MHLGDSDFSTKKFQWLSYTHTHSVPAANLNKIVACYVCHEECRQTKSLVLSSKSSRLVGGENEISNHVTPLIPHSSRSLSQGSNRLYQKYYFKVVGLPSKITPFMDLVLCENRPEYMQSRKWGGQLGYMISSLPCNSSLFVNRM